MKTSEELKYLKELKDNRCAEQKRNDDYSYLDDGGIEECECGAHINSHGHCPVCDY